MTTIRKALEGYYADPSIPFATPEAKYKAEFAAFGARLATDMEASGRVHDGWKYLNACWRVWDGRELTDTSPVHPDTLVEFCDYIGMGTVELIGEWVEQIKPLMKGDLGVKLAQLSQPFEIPSFDNLPSITFGQMIDFFRAQGADIAPDATLHAKDDIYHIPPIEVYQEAYRKSGLRRMTYIPQREDCDDFESVYKSFFSEHGYGNVAMGDGEITLWTADNQCTGKHDVNPLIATVNGEAKAFLFEPQTGQFHGMSEVWVGGGITGQPVRNQIYWLVF